MDNTSYSDPAVIDSVNKNFIPVRVDTDKRPDVNRRYNMGGWPTTAFLDNEGRIITGGVGLPPLSWTMKGGLSLAEPTSLLSN